MQDGASVAALQKAIIVELKLDIAPDRVRLLREVEGGAAVLLDSCEKLADQGVLEGGKVLVEVIAVPVAAAAAEAPISTALPVPLTFAEESLRGEPMMVASLPLTLSVAAPFYLTPLEHYGLVRFLQEPPSIAPQMLMLTGPVKSGKSRIVHDVLPRMLAARYATAPTTVRRPVIFRHTFVLGAAAEAAAEGLVDSLLECALSEGVALRRPYGKGLLILPYVAAELAQGVHQKGGELWLLFDELGAPIVASTPAGASIFTQQLKTTVELCSFYARIVGTGSGMVALLTAIRAARPNSFVLWDAISHVSLGREPVPPAALAMAEGILAAYATKWPPAIVRAITPQIVLAKLACSAHDQYTSPRPALVACLATLMGDARGAGSSPELVLAAAVRALLRKLREESVRDTAVALERMPVQQRKALRALAVLGLLPDARDEATADFVALLCEAGTPPKLLPPYGALLSSWISRDGSLAISSGDSSRLAESVTLNLAALLTFHKQIPVATRVAASKAALDMLARNGVGVDDEAGHAQGVRAPCTLEELSSIPAVKAIMRVLNLEAEARGLSESPSSAQLSKALGALPGSTVRTELMDTAGLSILLWIRNVEAHKFFVTDELPRAGLSSAVVNEVVQAALEVIVQDLQDSTMGFFLNEMGVLTRLSPERADKVMGGGGGVGFWAPLKTHTPLFYPLRLLWSSFIHLHGIHKLGMSGCTSRGLACTLSPSAYENIVKVG